jgi:hypothetical protein
MSSNKDYLKEYEENLKQEIIEAIKFNDVELLKKLKDQIGRDQWLKVWRDSGKGMEGWLEPNPFIEWKD